MRTRIEFHKMLEQLTGITSIYFQPPSSLKMKYPAIVYSMKKPKIEFAGNKKYLNTTAYTVTVIDKSSESEIKKLIEDIMYCSYDTDYISDNLHHYVYTIFF